MSSVASVPIKTTIFLEHQEMSEKPIIYISQADIANGPYIITNSGRYVLTSDLVFQPSLIYDYIIGIFAPRVTLDLNGYSISQGINYALYARNLSAITVGAVANVCPTKRCHENEIVIRNGFLGRVSDSDITTRSDFTGCVVIGNITFSDYETSAINSNHVGNLRCYSLTINNSYTNWMLNINYDYARKLVKLAKTIIADPRITPTDIINLANAISALETDLNYAAEKIINGDFSATIPWTFGIFYSKYIAGIYTTTRATIDSTTIVGFVYEFNVSNVIDNATGLSVVDSTGSNIQSQVFITYPSVADVIAWRNLMIIVSNLSSTYNLGYPIIPTAIITNLLTNGTTTPGYTYNILLFAIPAGIKSLNVSLKLCNTSVGPITVAGDVALVPARSIDAEHGSRIVIKGGSFSNLVFILDMARVVIRNVTVINNTLDIENYTSIHIECTTVDTLILHPLLSSVLITNKEC